MYVRSYREEKKETHRLSARNTGRGTSISDRHKPRLMNGVFVWRNATGFIESRLVTYMYVKTYMFHICTWKYVCTIYVPKDTYFPYMQECKVEPIGFSCFISVILYKINLHKYEGRAYILTWIIKEVVQHDLAGRWMIGLLLILIDMDVGCTSERFGSGERSAHDPLLLIYQEICPKSPLTAR